MKGQSRPQPPFALTVSAEARAVMEPLLNQSPPSEVLMRNPITRKAMRLAATHFLKPIAKARAARLGVEMRKGRVAGVPVKTFTKVGAEEPSGNRRLINFHGGGFSLDSGSLTESIPIAGLTGIPVVSVMYRLAPEHPYPAAVDDALAVYRASLETHEPDKIGIFGTSAGAVLTLQLLARIKAENLPMPAAAGVFSGAADLAVAGDCELYLPPLMGDRSGPDALSAYTDGTERTDPLLSPIYGDLSGFPPTLLMASTRDQLLSGTVVTHLALRRAGVAADLLIYEGMMHAFWAWIECPETEEALAAQAAFFAERLAR